MTTMRTQITLLSAVLLGLASLQAQDQLVKQALKKITSAEAGVKTLQAGDIRGANRLLGDLKYANKRLKAAYKKNTSHWKDAAKRLAACDKAVRAKAAAKPAPAGGPATGSSGAGNSGAGKQTGGATPPANGGAAAGPVIGEQFENLQQLNKEVKNGMRNLQMLNKTFMGDAFRVGSTTKEVRKLRERLAAFPAGDKNVKIVAANLDGFEGLFKKWQAEYKADNDAAGGLKEKLDAISAKYNAKAVPGQIFWPYDREKLQLWAARSKKLLDELPADIAVVQKATDNSLLGRRAKSMLHWVGRSIPDRLNGQVEQVRSQCDRAVEQSLLTAKSLRDIKPDDTHAIVNRVLTEGALERSMASLQKGLEAVDMAATVDLALQTKDAPDRTAQRKQIDETIASLRVLAKSALSEVRMPKPVKLDAAEIAKLTKIANETLARKKYGTGPIQHLVVTSKMQRKEKTQGDIRGTVTGATITSYHYVWDEYRVVTAEKVGEEVWIYHNTLKYYHSSDSVTPQDKWILSRRFQSTAILPENIKK